MPAADAALHKAIELDKNNADAIVKLGKVQIKEGAAEQALALYQKSIKENPREVQFYILAGELCEAKQDWDQAKSLYQQALGISPDNPLASNNLASVILEQGGNVDVAMGHGPNCAPWDAQLAQCRRYPRLGLLSQRRLSIGHQPVSSGDTAQREKRCTG